MVITLDWNVRDVVSIPTLGTMFPIPITRITLAAVIKFLQSYALYGC